MFDAITSAQNDIQTWTPSVPVPATESFADRCQRAIEVIKASMAQVEVVSHGNSYGKDSATTLALLLEAARQYKTEHGTAPKLISLTTDTRAELPIQVALAHTMALRAETFAAENGIDFEQIWVQPDRANHHLNQLIGGRGVASMPEDSNTCSVNMKITPMDKVRRTLAKRFGEQNILVTTGSRHAESTSRSTRLTERGESGAEAIRTANGSLMLAPIIDWTDGDVWTLLQANSRKLGFETLNFEPVVVHYEVLGAESCQTMSIAQTASKKSPCGSSRGGCFLCQKVTSPERSENNVIQKLPYLEPLVRLSRTIRAGHYVPENRSFVGKTVEDGRLKVCSSVYSKAWQSKLLKWVMSIDAREDDRVVEAKKTLERAKAEGKSSVVIKALANKAQRRWAPLLEEEDQLFIAFNWARYGMQDTGEFIRIKQAIMNGKRWDLPTDAELDALTARGDRKAMGKTYGFLAADLDNLGTTYRDHYRDLVADSACAPVIMLNEHGGRAFYKNSKGIAHDTMATADAIDVDLSAFGSDIEYEEFLFVYAMQFANPDPRLIGANAEMDFLVREGVITGKNGYQSQLSGYQASNIRLHHLRDQAPIDTLAQIQAHPSFISKADVDAQQAASASIIATDTPRDDVDSQMELFAA
jgi:DNA sulfur modification protein DndC